MNAALITGANRGLGLGMVKYLVQHNKSEKIIATCRNASEELKSLASQNKNVTILHLDVTQTSTFAEAAERVSAAAGAGGLNLLVNNAGVTTRYTKLPLVKEEQLTHNLAVNTVAPIMLTKSLLPVLQRAAAANTAALSGMGARRAAVLNLSSVLASIAHNDQGGFYPYRCSKAALNAATKSMSIDLKKDQILVVAMHPGWVRTDMGGKGAPLDVTTSVEGIFNTLLRLDDTHTGKFLQYDGTELPW